MNNLSQICSKSYLSSSLLSRNVKLGKQLNGINQAAVLLHSDCLYLFEEILGLAFEVWTDMCVIQYKLSFFD